MKALLTLITLLSLQTALHAQLWKSTAERVTVMTEELKLTPEQVTAVTAALDKFRNEHKRIRAEVAQEERKAAYTAANNILSEDLKAALTPEQFAASKDLEKRNNASMKAAKEARTGPAS